MPRFKTQLRGEPVEIEMELVHGPNPAFTIVFFNHYVPPSPLTREELARFCREAANVERN
jgi:hypothetical protein